MSIIYKHQSIVNNVEVYRVWKDGDLVGEFKEEHKADHLYYYLLSTRTDHFKQAIMEAYTQGRISMLKQNGRLADEYFIETYEDNS